MSVFVYFFMCVVVAEALFGGWCLFNFQLCDIYSRAACIRGWCL